MIIRKVDKDTEVGVMPSAEFHAAMLDYNRQMEEAGVLLQGVGLQASSKGARVKFSRGTATVTDGPFTETKELIAGFTMIEVASKEEAIEWVKRWPAIDANAEIEIRQVFTPEDFGADVAPSMREMDARLRDRESS
jgi:hypothetical protein